MKLIDWFNGNAKEKVTSNSEVEIMDAKQQSENEQNQDTKTELPNIPEHVFIEHEKPTVNQDMEATEQENEKNDLKSLYRFLERNLEKKGYEDALINPDTSYMETHVRYIHNELNLVLAKVKTYYSGHLRNINFHIETRKRSGMIETVDELLSHKATVEEDMVMVRTIEEDLVKKVGLSQNLFLSYEKGFKNGFAAITYNTILGKN
jgi:hypothetical protein